MPKNCLSHFKFNPLKIKSRTKVARLNPNQNDKTQNDEMIYNTIDNMTRKMIGNIYSNEEVYFNYLNSNHKLNI